MEFICKQDSELNDRVFQKHWSLVVEHMHDMLDLLLKKLTFH